MSYLAANPIFLASYPGLAGLLATRRGLGAYSPGAQAAINAGADPGLIATLQAQGVSELDFLLIANGAMDPVLLEQEVTGNSPAPGQNVMAASNVSQAVFGPTQSPQPMSFGVLPPAVISSAVSAGDAIASSPVLSWLESNWVYLAIGLGALIIVPKIL